jgi:hypothetical protein
MPQFLRSLPDFVQGRLSIAAPGACVLVATVDGQIAGVAAITSRGHVTLNYVASEFRSLGVSKALL